MILNLALRNWRAYETLNLELGPGTTFIVAANGVGKTSLILAAAWGVFGEASGVDAPEEIRGDAQTAEVSVVLRLPATGSVTITRSVNRRGKTKLEARAGNRVITEEAELAGLVSSELGGDLQVLGRLIFLAHGGSLETSQGEFDLRAHLAEVFGVTPLLAASQVAARMASEAAAATRKLKAGQKVDQQEAAKVAEAVAWVDQQIEETERTRREALESLESADALRRRAEEWERYRAGREEQERGLERVRMAAGALIPSGTPAPGTLTALHEAERNLLEELAVISARQAEARGQLAMIDEIALRLQESDAVCPTCLRPMSDHDAAAALAEHGTRAKQLKAAADASDAERNSVEQRLILVSRALSEARELPLPTPPPGGEIAAGRVEEIIREHQQAQFRLQELDRLLAELQAGKRVSQAKIAELAEQERQSGLIRDLMRREAVARAAADTMRATADSITNDQIEPLVTEVGRRWKLMFGAGGLHLSAQGQITRQLGSRTLPFGSLSGGEKVWALLLTRLLVTGASTSAPFVWLDEPLEHLDPRLRRVVAGTLARASQSGGLRQVVVTTYEAGLARQLMEDVPSASLIYVRSNP